MCFHFWFCLFSWITSSTIGLQLSPIAAGIKTFKSIIKKKKEKHNKRVLLAKSKLNVIKVLISKTLADSVISYDEFVLINNILKEYNKIKEEMKKKKRCNQVYSIYKTMLLYCLNCRRNTASKNPKTFSSKCLVCNIKFLNFLKNKKLENYGIILIC